MITLKDVAKLANVDVSTVSRAINNTSYVHPDTKLRILEAVSQLSYHPNLIEKGLRKGKRKTIGLVVPDMQLTIYNDLACIIEKNAVKNGYQVILCITNNDISNEKAGLQRLRDSFVDGIIIVGTGANNRLLRDIAVGGLPITQLMRAQDKTLSSVGADYKQAATVATSYLIEQGCKKIGLLNGPKNLFPYERRLVGYQEQIRQAGLQEYICNLPTLKSQYYQFGYESTLSLIQQAKKLDGLLVATDTMGMGAIRQLKKQHYQIPEEIKIISLTGYSIGRYLETTLSSIELPLKQIGISALNLLFKNIAEKQIETEHKIYSVKLILRETC